MCPGGPDNICSGRGKCAVSARARVCVCVCVCVCVRACVLYLNKYYIRMFSQMYSLICSTFYVFLSLVLYFIYCTQIYYVYGLEFCLCCDFDFRVVEVGLGMEPVCAKMGMLEKCVRCVTRPTTRMGKSAKVSP